MPWRGAARSPSLQSMDRSPPTYFHFEVFTNKVDKEGGGGLDVQATIFYSQQLFFSLFFRRRVAPPRARGRPGQHHPRRPLARQLAPSLTQKNIHHPLFTPKSHPPATPSARHSTSNPLAFQLAQICRTKKLRFSPTPQQNPNVHTLGPPPVLYPSTLTYQVATICFIVVHFYFFCHAVFDLQGEGKE